MSLPELQQNPLVQRVIDIFDTDGNGEVDFKGGPQRPLTALVKITLLVKNTLTVLVINTLLVKNTLTVPV